MVDRPANAGIGENYLRGWSELASALREGSSWSGRERNNAYLNLGGGRFVDASVVSGFDFLDDGRAVAVVDWDHDGRVDLWARNRTGPQLRFLRNDVDDAGHWISLRLSGRQANRDAIGAVVEIVAGGRRRLHHVSAGRGYLAQSSSDVHIGLGEQRVIDSITIRWPAGEVEAIEPPQVDAHYRVVEGSGRAEAMAPPSLRWPTPQLTSEPVAAPPTRLLLKTPLPLPPALLEPLGIIPGQPTLVNLWAQWCTPCAAEVTAYARDDARLAEVGVAWRPLSLDVETDHEAASAWLAARWRDAGRADEPTFRAIDARALSALRGVLQHVSGVDRELPIPASLLVDARGRLQLVYLGAILPDRFLSDARIALDADLSASRRALWPGRWYYRSRRNLVSLAEAFEADGRPDLASFYREIELDRN